MRRASTSKPRVLGDLAARSPRNPAVRSQTLVFVGPTLPADEVRARLPEAEVLPPAAVGDLLRAARRGNVGRIAIIDGYFERMAAVWHKEILLALETGIAVWGAASMGALRAAELDAYGMIGVGWIYDAYRRGRLGGDRRGALVADDEVAVAHGPAEYGYAQVSDALVNIRYGLAAATRARIIDARTAEQLLELARGRFYRERSWRRLFDDAKRDGLDIRRLEGWPKPDRKAMDARLLLRRLRDERPAKPATVSVPRTWALRQLQRLMLPG